jgi:isopentenyldiphosphate isomerase
MNSEILDVYDENMKKLGSLPRNEVHSKGCWHKAFHCWLYQLEDGIPFLIFQKRQWTKDTFPNLLDISAAGHLLSGEDDLDGIREVEEELGIKVPAEDLIPAGLVKYEDYREKYIDKELSYVYFYHLQESFTRLRPNEEEVSGVYRVGFLDLLGLFKDEGKSFTVFGFEVIKGLRVDQEIQVSKSDFVPHPSSYYELVFDTFKNILSNGGQ